MNAIGQFGRFITEYQTPIQIVLIIIILAGASYAAFEAVVHGREKKRILLQINETVTEINTAVNNLNEKKKADVIYIDNRVPGQAPYQTSAAAQEEQIVKETPPSEDDNRDAWQSCEKEEVTHGVSPQTKADEPAIAEEMQEETGQAPEEEDSAENIGCEEDACYPKKYFSRDCAVSKNGKTYTIEQLNEQIKE